jgi:hypothetical protein
MTMTSNETRTRPGTCRTHGQVVAEKTVPRLKFPFVVTSVARGVAAMRPYRCPECGSKA